MKKIINKPICLVLSIIILQSLFLYSYAAENINDEFIDVKQTVSQDGRSVELSINVENLKNNLSFISFYIDYDDTIFEEITSRDFTYEDLDEDYLSYFSYSSAVKKVVIEFDDDVEINKICKVKLKVREDYSEEIDTAFVIKDLYCYSYNDDVKLRFDEKQVKVDMTIDIIEEPIYEDLYLSTKKYRIGNEDIENYKEGDTYISRVDEKTTLEEFINNLDTNGDVKVLKTDNSELTNTEYVGTGMKLVVTKGEAKIELLIAVKGDLDGNGKITATDLSILNHDILGIKILNDVYKIAGDLNESETITATDLSMLNHMILGID